MRDIFRLNARKWGIFFEESGVATFPGEMLLDPESRILYHYSGTGTGKGIGIGNPTKKGEL
jgi:hypothetical protein